MKIKKSPAAVPLASFKVPTGIEGFDRITQGGLPRGRTTLIEGGPGSGKTIMALQSLVHGASVDNEPGIFVAFEESAQRLASNASKFGWDLENLQKKKLFFLDAQPAPDIFQAGSFDLSGMLAALEAKAKEIGARRIVFDALDVMLALLNDPIAERREVYRLHEWLLKNEFSAIITAKSGDHNRLTANLPQLSFMQYVVDCAVLLIHVVSEGISHRSLRVAKYRGSAFSENEAPFLIGNSGFMVAGSNEFTAFQKVEAPALTERISSGIERLDTMLGGGYYRGAGILITGFPGTAKSTLSGSFAEAACGRGERTLVVSFDSDANEVIRNLSSVNIRLERFMKKGVLRFVSARAISVSAEIHLMQIKLLATEHRASCLVIDPVSALGKTGNDNSAYSVSERLIDWTKASGITLLCTSLLHEVGLQEEGTPLQISTLADTWIHLNYHIHAGERNRGLSIVKSRGTAHSNQVREMILSDKGVTLADAYTAGGEVLMGTLRWEKERAVQALHQETEAARKLKQATIEAEEALLEVKLKALQLDLAAKRTEKELLTQLAEVRSKELALGRTHLDELRGVDEK